MSDRTLSNPPRRSLVMAAIRILAILTVLTFAFTGISSSLPDGMEASAEKVGVSGSDPIGGISLEEHLPSDWWGRALGIVGAGVVAWGMAALANRRLRRAAL